MQSITRKRLLQIIHEEVERNTRWSAGFYGGGNGDLGGGPLRGKGLPGLGSDEEQDDEDHLKDEEKEVSMQAGPRADRRNLARKL